MIKQYIEVVIALVSLIIVLFFAVLFLKGKHSIKASKTENLPEKSEEEKAIHNL